MKWLTEVSTDELKRLVAEDEFFWLDLKEPRPDQVEAVVLDPEAESRALQFGRSPELRRYDKHVGMVFYGAVPGELIEVHVYVSGDWVITLHEKPCPPFDDLRHDLAQAPAPSEESVVGLVLGALAGSFEDLIDPIDERIEKLESEAVDVEEGRGAPGGLRHEILERRSRLLRALRIVRRQRDYVDRAVDELDDLPGLQASQHHELRDVSAQMIRVTDAVDDALDRLAAALDLLNSAVSNRMNAVMERLTIVATIFLPLTVVTGFFGMNFEWLTNRMRSGPSFFGLGVAVLVVSAFATYFWMRSRLELGDRRAG
ncbi:MAG TPA: CorA family divalent cation transporter [Thermoleophilaceae bacterium]